MATKPSRAAAPAAAPAPQAVAIRASTAVALPADLAADLAQFAKDAAAKERPSISKISLKGGMMTYMNSAMPNNKIDVVLLACAYRNAYYPNPYDPNNIVNPSCFAIQADKEEGMRPHENVTEPVNETCAGCPKAEWGSDPRPGSRGKACKEGRRLICIPADALASPDAVKTAEMAIIDVPVTSVKRYANFVNALAAQMNLPMWAVVTNVEVIRDPKIQFYTQFTPMRAIGDPEVIAAIRERLDGAVRAACIPYDESAIAPENQKAADPKAAAKTAKFKGK